MSRPTQGPSQKKKKKKKRKKKRKEGAIFANPPSEEQIGYIVLFFAKFWINCLNIKSDVPVNNLHKSLTYLKKC